MDAKVLVAAYARNAEDADKRYKAVRLRITGVVAEEPALYRRSPLLALEGTGIHDRPVAVLDAARKEELAGLRTGQPITLDCLGNGHVSGTPMLKNCTLVQERP
ncbi:OB-fold protein [Stenotrophomonas maltophilia]|uniref:OB-fold protein n=1 Tax=Stenotrophomonas maltophilia TaxID=40324 RepID=UPI00039A92CC